jgi:hypothetical protein
MTSAQPWDDEGYWNTVIGPACTAMDVVDEWKLTPDTIDAWLAESEREAWDEMVEEGPIPAEWAALRARARAALERAARGEP